MDTLSPFAIKDVEVLSCDLGSPTLKNPERRGLTPQHAAVLRDARAYMNTLSIYESVFNPTLTGELRVQDDMNLSSLVPLIGLETLTLKFRIFNPRTEKYRYYPYNESDSLIFAIYNQTERIPQSQSTETYRLGLTSRELILSSEKKFSRTFTNKRVEDVISDVLTQYVGTDKPFGSATSPDGQPYFETTTTPFSFVAPYISPLGAIKLATLQASASGNRANYFFYETLDGFYFRSLQQMIEVGRKRWQQNPIYIRRQMSGSASTRPDDRFLSAEQIDIVNNFDYLYAVSQGYFASSTIGVDVLSGKYRVTASSVSDPDFQSRQRLNRAESIYPSQLARVANPTSRMFVIPTTSISAKNTAIAPINRPPDNFLEQTLSRRNRELIELQTFTVRVKLAGAPNINIGSVVYIEIPNVWNNGGGVKTNKDLRSGLYLILAVKHTLINKSGGAYQYETTFEACSDSFGT